MATVKEVQLMDGENEVTPIVLSDSIRDSDGSKFVENLNTALGNKSDEGHNHDDRYYTENEVNTKLDNILPRYLYDKNDLSMAVDYSESIELENVGQMSCRKIVKNTLKPGLSHSLSLSKKGTYFYHLKYMRNEKLIEKMDFCSFKDSYPVGKNIFFTNTNNLTSNMSIGYTLFIIKLSSSYDSIIGSMT